MSNEKYVKEIKKQCLYLQSHEDFIEKILKPLKNIIPHDAHAVTSVDAETYNPRYISYGFTSKYLRDITNIKIEDVRGMKKSFELAMQNGYNTSTTESFGYDFRDDAAYKIIFEPYGFKHAMQTYFFSKSGAFLGVYSLTKKTSPGFNDEEMKLYEQVGPYILHAFRKYRWLVNIEFFNKLSLNDIVFPFIITDKDKNVIWSNSLAKETFSELNSSNKLPDGFKKCFNQIRKFFQNKKEPYIYREIEVPTIYGNTICFAFNKSSSKHLPVNGEGFLFIVDSNHLNFNIVSSLTVREKDTLKLICNGKLDKEIASTMGISIKTVNNYVRSIFKKLNVTNRSEAAVKALRLGVF